MNFNLKHYSNVWRMHPKKEMYCFPLSRFLGENGLFQNHELKGKTFIRKENNKEYIVDDVYVHWWLGWYFVALIRDNYNSHGQMTWNINSNLEDFTLDLFELKK